MSALSAVEYALGHRRRFLSELKEFVRIPSISSQPAHSKDVRQCAEWLANHLEKAGLESVRVVATSRAPIVYGQWLRAPGRPTVLVYGHYDVQPVDPLSQWRTPPFETSVRGGRLHGRGASDDKGQLFTHVKAIESYLAGGGRPPVNVKYLFEGEEEVGSPALPAFVERNRRALAADVVAVSDTRMLGPGRPALTCSTRGQLALEIEIAGPGRDLHSGNFGGAVHNPLQALCEILGRLHDKDGRVAIPGFYDRVRRIDDQEREYMRDTGPTNVRILRDAKVRAGWGEKGFSLYERVAIRPALTINGLSGGYEGPGPKGVIPARARAKLSFRLVPNQEPREIETLFRRHLSRITPGTVRSAVRVGARVSPAEIDRRHPAIHAASAAFFKGFGRAPVFVRSGGSIPAVDIFQRTLGAPVALMGYALPGDSIHAPNESFSLVNFHRGIETCIWFLSEIGRRGSAPRLHIGPGAGLRMGLAPRSSAYDY